MRRKSFLLRILTYLIIPVVLLIVGGFISLNFKKYESRTQYLDYRYSIENLSDITDRSIDIKFDTISVVDLHRIEFILYNFNEEDVEDFDVFVDFYGEKEGSVSILYSEVMGNGDSIESVQLISNTTRDALARFLFAE